MRRRANFGLILSFVLGSPCSSEKEGRREDKGEAWFNSFKIKVRKIFNLFVSVCVRKTLTHFKGGFGWFKSVLWFVFEWILFWKEVFRQKRANMLHFSFQPDASLPR